MDKEEVNKITKLAKLRLTDVETNKMQEQLQIIIDVIKQLQEIDCSNVEPLASVLSCNLRTRSDEAESNTSRDKLFENAPKKNMAQELKYFVVPKVIE